MIWRCEICGFREPVRARIFGSACAAECGEIHWVHRWCAEKIGIWETRFACWAVKACPDAVKVADKLMGDA